MLIRIITENKNYDKIVKLVADMFDGATFIKAEGLWKGKTEHSLIIEIDGGRLKVENLVYAIKKLNSQSEVLVQYIEANSKLI